MSDQPGVPAAEFRLSVTTALRDQLNASMQSIDPGPLTQGSVDLLSARGGVYQLFEGGRSVYIGKANTNLPGRLTKHVIKLGGRVGHLLDRMTYRCVYVDEDLHAVSAERLLIAENRPLGLADWNYNGFGNNDPGKNRDRSLVKEAHFDRAHPIDLSVVVTITRPRRLNNLGQVMDAVKKAMPYTFRFARKDAAWAAVRAVEVQGDEVPDTLTADEWLHWLAAALPEGWTLVTLPGYVIGYPGLDAQAIGSRTGVYRRDGEVVVFEGHAARFDEGAVPKELLREDDED